MEKIWIIFFSTFSAVLAKPLLKANPYNMVEFPALLGFSSFLLCVFVSLYDIFAMFVVIESLFFLFLCLSVFNFAKFTIESCIKYFIQNVFVAGLSGFGIFIIYFICQSANLFIIKESVRFFMELNY
jgi:NADH:ubiquinone oxidoreductase subunit 2 (subunit N)